MHRLKIINDSDLPELSIKPICYERVDGQTLNVDDPR